MLGQLERPAAVDPDRLERRPAAQQRLVVGAQHRLGRIDDAAASDRDREQAHRAPHLDRRADRGEERPRLRPRLLDLRLRLRVPDDAAADPEMDPVLGDRERPDRQRQVEVAVAADDAERAHRRAAADGLERGDQVERGDLRRAGDGAAGERRRQQLGEPDLLPQRSLDGRDEVGDAGELALDHQLRPAHGAGLADAGEVVALEVDDHHVLGGVLLALDVLAERARPLDRRRPDAPAAPGEEELGRGGHDGPAVAGERPRPERAEPVRERGRAAVERRREVLDEVDLVDVPAPDRLAHRLDRLAVVGLGPGPLPLANRDVSQGQSLGRVPHGHGRERQRARLRRRGRVRAAQRLREAVAEIEIRLERLAAGREEASLAQVRLDLLERALGRVQLEHGYASERAPPRGGTRRRGRDRRRASARRRSGSAAPPAPRSSSAAGRSRTRPCRTPRGASASR